MSYTQGLAQMTSCQAQMAQPMYMYIQPETIWKDFHLINKFKKPIHYQTRKVNGQRSKLFFSEAKNEIPINIYFNKRTKYIFMIEIVAEDARQQFALRDFLQRNGTDLGNLNCFIGKYRTVLEDELGVGQENMRINKKCLDYKTNFGIISFLVTRDLREKEWIKGVRILFDKDS